MKNCDLLNGPLICIHCTFIQNNVVDLNLEIWQRIFVQTSDFEIIHLSLNKISENVNGKGRYHKALTLSRLRLPQSS